MSERREFYLCPQEDERHWDQLENLKFYTASNHDWLVGNIRVVEIQRGEIIIDREKLREVLIKNRAFGEGAILNELFAEVCGDIGIY